MHAIRIICNNAKGARVPAGDVHLTIYGFAVHTVLRCKLLQIAVLADVNSKIGPYCCATVTRPNSARNRKLTAR